MKSLAVLITCHNRKEKTIACLKSLHQCLLPENYIIDVFLVDDGSTDGTAIAVKANFPETHVIQGNGNLYWNQGMYMAWNIAVKYKKYDYFLWLNDDTILFKDSLNLILNYSWQIENKKILVGSTCSDKNGEPTYGGFVFPDIKIFPNNTWQDCDFFNGNIVLIPFEIYQKVGVLDKRFRHSLGDIDYGMRAKKMGFTHALAPVFLGFCNDHETEPFWRNKQIPVYKRIKSLYSPLGNNPFEAFIFENRHNGFYLAVIRFFSNHLRAIFPQLWNLPKDKIS